MIKTRLTSHQHKHRHTVLLCQHRTSVLVNVIYARAARPGKSRTDAVRFPALILAAVFAFGLAKLRKCSERIRTAHAPSTYLQVKDIDQAEQYLKQSDHNMYYFYISLQCFTYNHINFVCICQ